MTRGAIGIVLTGIVLVGCNPRSPARVDWEDPEVFSRNREPARSFFIPFSDRGAALAGDPINRPSFCRSTVRGNSTGQSTRLIGPFVSSKKISMSVVGRK